MVFTTEYNKKDGIVEIYCDKEGLEFLIQRLFTLKKNGGHEHLMTPSWSGNELTETKQAVDNELINHLCIILKPEKSNRFNKE